MEKWKAEPFSKTQAFFRSISTENCDWLHRKRKDWSVPKDSSLVSFLPHRELCLITSNKKRPNRSQRLYPNFVYPNRALWLRKRQDWTVPHHNRELCIVISKKTRLNRCPPEQRSLHCYIEKGKTEPFPRLTFLILSKINRSHKSHQFISKV